MEDKGEEAEEVMPEPYMEGTSSSQCRFLNWLSRTFGSSKASTILKNG